MYTSEQHPQSSRRDWSASATSAIEHALRRLEVTRDMARERLREFSMETLRTWNALEQEIEDKVDDLEGRMSATGETALDVALARIQELTRAVEQLVSSHLACPARSFMKDDVLTISADDSLAQAARLLWDCDCGALPVVDGTGKLVAMITDRDICMAVYTQGCDPGGLSVGSAMSQCVHTCAPDDSIQRVLEIMSEHQVRRVPVVDGSERLLGIVSLADVARYLNTLSNDHPARSLLVPALAAISDRRSQPSMLA